MIELKTYHELDAFLAALKICGRRVFFNIKRENGDIEEYQADNYKTVEDKMQAEFAEECESCGIKNGELMEEWADIVVVLEGEDDWINVALCPILLSYEGYHGDYAEHNLNYRGGFL